MKNNSFIKEVVVSIILMALAAFIVNPTHIWMPDSMAMMIILVLLIVFGVLASFVWRERARDEREGLHRMHASRAAYLAGSGVLVLGIAIQGLRHDVDLWLVFALGAMILAKLFTVYAAGRRE